jgi:hypothetical protein
MSTGSSTGTRTEISTSTGTSVLDASRGTDMGASMDTGINAKGGLTFRATPAQGLLQPELRPLWQQHYHQQQYQQHHQQQNYKVSPNNQYWATVKPKHRSHYHHEHTR